MAPGFGPGPFFCVVLGRRMSSIVEGTVERVAACRLLVGSRRWAWADERASAIDAHWARRLADNPAFFNGRIYVMAAGGARIEDGVLHCELVATDFKSFLYWRDQGYPDAGVADCFGSAILRSKEGHVILGRQRAGHVNGGLAYFPGGFIDHRDVAADGSVDIAASIERELAEETGIEAGDTLVSPGFLVIRPRGMVSIAREFTSRLTSAALKAAILARIAQEEEPELAGVVVVASPADAEGLAMPPHTALAIRGLVENANPTE